MSVATARTVPWWQTSLPHSCDVKRLVSAYNLFKDDNRCSISAEIIDAYFHVHVNMPLLADFDPRPTL
jgi:hypothetical protein